MKEQSAADLLRLSRSALSGLRRRGAVRTLNAPIGDWTELLVEIAFDGEAATASEKGWDVQTAGGERLQGESRATNRSTHYSMIRSWAFDAAVFALFIPHDLCLREAKYVPMAEVRALGKFVEHVNGARLTIKNIKACVSGMA